MKFAIAFIITMVLTMVLKVNFWGTLAIFLLLNYFSHVIDFRRNSVKNRYVNELFFVITFEVMGHISKAKGRVTENDIRFASAIMDILQCDDMMRQAARQAFNRGKNPDYRLRKKLQEFYHFYAHNRELIWYFVEIQLDVVLSDGVVDSKEREILAIIAAELHIPPQELEQRIRIMLNDRRFQQNGNKSTATELESAYNILGINAKDDEQTIKRAYRHLMNQHHPDKLMSKGVPAEMLELAKKKTQQIQAAYDLIRQTHGF